MVNPLQNDGGLTLEQQGWEPKLLGFLCRWCSYAGADLAGTSRTKYPPNIRIIRVPCSGRVDPLFILKALRMGADGVLVSGCHPGDCHYLTGNYYARRKFAITRKLLEFVGVDPRRVQFSWVSASEGKKFAQVVDDVVDGLKEAGPNEMFD
jgi:coenzyme F420-reducing hydrogenase delta subunit